MKRIIVIDGKWDTGSPMLQYIIKASKGADTEVSGVFLTADSGLDTIIKAKFILNTIKEKFFSEGIAFTPVAVGPDAGEFLRKMESLKPASLVLTGDVRFSDKMKKGGASLEALKEKMNCPVVPADALGAARKEGGHAKGTNWVMWTIYAVCSALMYVVFYPNVKALNETVFMTGTVLGAVATLAVVIGHAWVWGNTTHILPRLFKLEK